MKKTQLVNSFKYILGSKRIKVLAEGVFQDVRVKRAEAVKRCKAIKSPLCD